MPDSRLQVVDNDVPWWFGLPPDSIFNAPLDLQFLKSIRVCPV